MNADMGMQGAWDPPANAAHPVASSADPREGSAAWRAEQIATGQIPISVGARPLGSSAEASRSTDTSPLIGSLVKIGIVVAIAFFVWFRFFYSTAPTSDEIKAAFVPIAGYEYGAADSATAKTVEGIAESYPGFEDEISDFQAREIYSGGRVVGIVMIGGFEYSDDIQSDFEAGAVDDGGMAVTLGLTGKTFTAYEASKPPAHAVMWLDEDGYLYGVVTSVPVHARNIASALGSAAL